MKINHFSFREEGIFIFATLCHHNAEMPFGKGLNFTEMKVSFRLPVLTSNNENTIMISIMGPSVSFI